jgi:O-antigen ligase
MEIPKVLTMRPRSRMPESSLPGGAPLADGFAGPRVALLLVLAGAPWAFGAMQAWAWASLCIGIAVAASWWAVAWMRHQSSPLLLAPLNLAAAALLALAVLQCFVLPTADLGSTQEAAVKLAAGVLVLFLAVNLFSEASPQTWNALGWIIAVYTFAIAVFAIVQGFSSPDRVYWTIKPRWGGYIFGPYISHNLYAGLMELLIPISAGFFLGMRPEQSERYLAGFATVIGVTSVILSGSRGGIVALTVESVVLLMVILRARVPTAKVLAIVAFVIIAVAGSTWLLPATVSERFSAGLRSPDVSYGERKNMTLDSWRIFRAHPLTGTGLGSFETIYPQYQSFVSDQVQEYAHNDYVQVLAETGVAGGALVLAAIALFLWSFRKHLQVGLHSPACWIRLGAFIGIAGLAVHSWVDFNLHSPANAAWFAFLAGLTQCAPRRVALPAMAPAAIPARRRHTQELESAIHYRWNEDGYDESR